MKELIIQMQTDGTFPTGMKKVGEIVRCKDCKYYHPNYCEEWSRYGTIQTKPDEYCCRAERKTE